MHKSFGFKYSDEGNSYLFKPYSMGHSIVNQESYQWHGLQRGGQGYIFQYSLNGVGKIRIGKENYRVPGGSAFFVSIPSDHEYSFDASLGEQWEFIWIRFEGMRDEWFRQDFIQSFGYVYKLNPDAFPIQLLWRLYKDTAANNFRDRFDLSLRIYEWLLSLQRYLQDGGTQITTEIPLSYRRVADYVQLHLEDDLSLEQLADVAKLDKYYFCKMFPQYFRTTPMAYVRNRRIEKAAELLRDEQLPITAIAAKCGYSSLSYFGKVFHKVVGMSPVAFRQLEGKEREDYLRLLE
ncbi:helix-turn-helix domain-containing protein [Paenibacillus sp. strain BS8-2]